MDELPKTGSGKILKRELRAPYWAGRTSPTSSLAGVLTRLRPSTTPIAHEMRVRMARSPPSRGQTVAIVVVGDASRVDADPAQQPVPPLVGREVEPCRRAR